MPAEQNCPTFFVTGTDTGIGKTIVTAALARHFRQAGLSVGVMKPIETGVENIDHAGADAELLRWAAGSEDPDELIAPYRFAPPVAPAQAAQAGKVHIDPGKINEYLRTIRQGKDLVLVEGAGGLMVPVQGGFLMADLVKTLDLPLIVVSHPRLGTINHTLLTTFTARAMEINLAGFIINRMPSAPGDVEQHAPHQLSAMASADLLGVLPEVEGDDRSKVKRLADEIGHLTTYHWLAAALGVMRDRRQSSCGSCSQA